jgi:hypothetical protein
MPARCAVSPGSRMSGQRTGPPLLAVEVITALLLGTLAARVHHGLVLAAACRLTPCGVPLAFIDAEHIGCRMVLTGSAFAGTTLLLIPTTAASGNGRSWRGPS